MKVTRSQLRSLIHSSINESNIIDKNITVDDGKIIIGDSSYKVQANAGWKTAGQFVDVFLSSVKMVSSGLQVVGTAMGTGVDELVPNEKANEINRGVESGVSSFEVKGKKATFKFSKLS